MGRAEMTLAARLRMESSVLRVVGRAGGHPPTA